MKTINILSGLLTCFFLLGGCTPHRAVIKEPAVGLPSSYSETEEVQSLPAGRWWEHFEDERLNRLMEEAFKKNLDIVQAYERLRQSRAAASIARSSKGLIAGVEGSGGWSRQSGFFRGSTSESQGFGAAIFDTYTLSAAASYEIDIWGKLSSNSRAARFDALASEQDLKAMYISTSARLADLYYLAVEQRAQLELSDQTIKTFQDTLNRVERRYRAGLVSSVDVYQSRQNLSSAGAQRPVFERDLATTVNALSVLTGSFPDGEIGGTAKELKDVPQFPLGIPSELLDGRPDIRSAYLRLKASDERTAVAIADRFPSFNLVGSYGGTSGELKSVLDSPNIFWNILLQAAQPLLDGGRRKAEVDRTKAVFREHLAKYHKAVLTAFHEVEDALARGNSAEKRVDVLYERVSASESELRIALNNYLQGLTDYLPVLTAQQRYYEAASTLLTAKRQLISARIQLARALGGGWADDIMEKRLTTNKQGIKK
jgi:NodT family efflux transporter outer membrane factor (OMF) lipoprotein